MVHTLTCSIKLWINGGGWKSTKMFIKVFSVFSLIDHLKLSCSITTNGATNGNVLLGFSRT